MTRLISTAVILFFAAVALPAPAATDWQVVKTFQIGGQGSWDYLTVDPGTHRLYVPRSTHTMVIDSAIRQDPRRHSRSEDRPWRRDCSRGGPRIHQ